MFKPRQHRLALSLLLIATSLAGTATARGEQASGARLFVHSDTAMGTRITLTVWSDDEPTVAEGAKAVFAEFKRVDRLMTSWLADSDVSRINAAAGGRPVRVGSEVLAVIERAQAAARESGGAFDITVGAFRGLWKFDEDIDGSVPDPAEVRARLPLVGYRNVVVNRKESTVKLRRKGMRITLGGIAKGYAVDRAAKLLHERGIRDFILQAGGDLYASGQRGDRRWRVGIRDPRGARDAVFALTEIEDATFSTSGDYERSVLDGNVRYHHILDPATGFPAARSRSVTVMARDALTADVWSTALFVIGAEDGMKLVEKLPFEAVFVDAENQVHVSSGLKKSLVIRKPPTPGP